jgi:hypothetical protein
LMRMPLTVWGIFTATVLGLLAFPALAAYAYETRVFTAIGYIHLIMLGFLSLFILTYFIVNETYKDHLISRIGMVVFTTGIVLSEIILFTNGVVLSAQGNMINNYSLLILITSSLMPLGIIILWVIQLGKKTRSSITV